MEFRVPSLAEGIEVAKVVRVGVDEGSTVEPGGLLLELETDKVTMEVESPVAGRVQEVRVREGEEVRVGSVVMVIDEAAAAGDGAPRQEAPAERPVAAPPAERSEEARASNTGPAPEDRMNGGRRARETARPAAGVPTRVEFR